MLNFGEQGVIMGLIPLHKKVVPFMMKKTVSLLICSVMLIVSIISSGFYVLALGEFNLQIAKKDGTFLLVSSCANASEALAEMKQNGSEDAVITNANGTVLAMKRGMAVSATYLQSMANQTLSFIDNYGDTKPYITNGYALYFNSSSVYNGEFVATVTISGLTNRAYANQLRLIPYVFFEEGGAFEDKYFLDFYSVNGNNELVHTLSTFTKLSDSWKETCEMASIVIDKAPPFMSQGVRYYSSDGKNFYLDSKLTSKAGTHYIYYKYLSYRSKTSYTKDELNRYIDERNINISPEKPSALINKAEAFLNAQNNYGINAAMELAFANHESYYGKSSYAINKKNLFGINANDSNPDDAFEFTSVDECINKHAMRYLSWGYFDANAYIPSSLTISDPVYEGGSAGGDWRYFGSSAGNKSFGVNVAYASDPYHGEKIAAHMYRLDKYLGFKDYKKYNLGETNKITEVYSGPDINSQKLYQLSHRRNNSYPVGMPVVIQGEQGSFYKIQSDMPVRFDITGNTSGLSFYKWNYDLNTAVAYVLKSDITAFSAPAYDTVDVSIKQSEQYTIDKTGLPATLEFLSGDTAIATVTPEGLITGIDAGNTTITIKDSTNGLTIRQINLIVYDTINSSIKVNEQYSVDKIGLPATLQFLSSDTTIATVTAEGLITGIAEGNTTITTKNSKNGLIVKQINLMVFNTVDVSIKQSEQYIIDKTALPTTLEFSSGDTAIATVTSEGVISAIGAGNTTITIKDSTSRLTVRQINVKVNSLIVAPSPIASRVYHINTGNKIISKIAQNTTVSAFLAGLADSSYIFIYKDENQISGNSLLTTGSVVKLIKDGTVYETYTVAITGDINGDGNITSADFVLLRNHLLEINILHYPFGLSADINGDGKISSADFVLLRNHLLETEKITPKSY